MPLTYDTLVKRVADYIERDDVFDMIPHFVAQAEDRICLECPNLGFETHVTGVLRDEENGVIAKPARWRRTLGFTIGTTLDPLDLSTMPNENRKPLMARSYDLLRASFPNQTQRGEPSVYADFGYGHLLVAPAPDKDYPFELVYLERPAPLTIEHQTNWLSEYASPLLFYGCLLESAPYVKTDERVPVWQALYDRSLQSLSQSFSSITPEKVKVANGR